MAASRDDDVHLHVETAGDGEPLVLVHGSWSESESWSLVVPALAADHRVVTYDRRGHGRSRGHGPLERDVDDLAAVIGSAGPPARVVANSTGATIALRLLLRDPALVRSAAVHEPPLLDLLGPAERATHDDAVAQVLALLRAGDHVAGARLFIDDVVVGRTGAWDSLPAEQRERIVRAAPTYLEETADPTRYDLDLAALAATEVPVLLTWGARSPEGLRTVSTALAAAAPRLRTRELRGGHLPHLTHPEPYLAALRTFHTST